MTEHPNIARIRSLFEAFHNQDIAAVLDLVPEHALWHFPGKRGGLAGTHRGRDEILAFFMNVQQLTAGSFHLDLIDVLANDTNAVALFRGHGERNGKRLDNPTCLRMRLESGKIVEAWEFVWNLHHVEDFWS